MKGESSLLDRDATECCLPRAADGDRDFTPLRKDSCDFAAGTSARCGLSDTACYLANVKPPSELPSSVSDILSFPFTRLLKAERRLGLWVGSDGWLWDICDLLPIDLLLPNFSTVRSRARCTSGTRGSDASCSEDVLAVEGVSCAPSRDSAMAARCSTVERGVDGRVRKRIKRAVWLPSRRKVYGYVRLWVPQDGGDAVTSELGKTGVWVARGRDQKTCHKRVGVSRRARLTVRTRRFAFVAGSARPGAASSTSFPSPACRPPSSCSCAAKSASAQPPSYRASSSAITPPARLTLT